MSEPSIRIDLTNPDLYAHGNPYAVWRWLREHDPVYRHPATDLPEFWALTKYEDVRTVYRDAGTFSSAGGIILRPEGHGVDPGGGHTLALTDPPRHRQLRALVDDWFSPRSVRAYETEMRELAREVITRALVRENCDFVSEIAARIPLYVICKLMGIPKNDWEWIFDRTNDAFGASDPVTRRAAHLEILDYFAELGQARAKSPSDDLVSVLAAAKIDGKALTPDEIILNCDNLLVGGTENTRIAASGGMLAFLRNPGEWHSLSENPELMPSAVEEVLRWTSTATHIMRTTTRPVTLRGCQIGAGERVTLWNASANRDETVFDDPDRFTIGRRPNRHLALGTGEHFCLGGTLGRAELRLLFEELIRTTGAIELDGAPVMLSSIVVNGPERLPVRLVPRGGRW